MYQGLPSGTSKLFSNLNIYSNHMQNQIINLEYQLSQIHFDLVILSTIQEIKQKQIV
jgi:hypothetical protein